MYEIFPDAQDYLRSKLESIASKYYYNFKPYITQLDREMIKCLKNLSSDKAIIITRPDKGNGVVLLNKIDYITKMENILQDSTKFTRVETDVLKAIFKYEDRNNTRGCFTSKFEKLFRMLLSLKLSDIMNKFRIARKIY